LVSHRFRLFVEQSEQLPRTQNCALDISGQVPVASQYLSAQSRLVVVDAVYSGQGECAWQLTRSKILNFPPAPYGKRIACYPQKTLLEIVIRGHPESAQPLRLPDYDGTPAEGYIPMRNTTLAIGPSLRAIGQALEALQIHSFKLEKRGDKYIVSNWEQGFLDGVAERVWGRLAADRTRYLHGQRTAPLEYTSSDRQRLANRGRLRRGQRNMPAAQNLSSRLRVIGDYLDKKETLSFAIAWSLQSVTINYQTCASVHREEHYTLQDLYDLEVSMYLRQSRHRAVS